MSVYKLFLSSSENYSRKWLARMNRVRWPLLICLFLALLPLQVFAFIQIKNGYFWDNDRQNYFLPHGVAYQVWNPAVFANQSFEQIEYDLKEMKAMGANSLRVEFVWGEVETQRGIYDFSKTDFLVQKATELGLKLFILIGYQYAPLWAVDEGFMAVHREPGQGNGRSLILNYNHPGARQAYADYLAAVSSHYKDSKAVAAWILGNEFAYYDLWEDPNVYREHRFVGFDEQYSIPAYRAFLAETYHNDIHQLNAAWGTSYSDFNTVPMAEVYPPDRFDRPAIQTSGYHDLIQWRERSIGDFIAAGAVAVKAADPNHLLTYAMVGAIFSGVDANITAEDPHVILERCREAGAPLDFWTINGYPWPITGSEMRSLDYAISKYAGTVGIPIMVSETGISSNDTLLTEAPHRYVNALVSLSWEALLSGAIGVHLFHWSDRNDYLAAGFPLAREAGFGLVNEDRTQKSDAFDAIAASYRRMEEIKLAELLPRAKAPAPDVLIYGSNDGDLGSNRWNQETAMIFAAFKRIGLQARIIDDTGYDLLSDNTLSNDGILGEANALYLPRNYKMSGSRLDALDTQFFSKGWNIHASADLPGRFNQYHDINLGWQAHMDNIFGLDVSSAVPGTDGFALFEGNWPAGYKKINLNLAHPLGTFSSGHLDVLHFGTWKFWHGLEATHGTTIFTHSGLDGAQPATPALQITAPGNDRGKTAFQAFAVGDITNFNLDGNDGTHPWTVRSAMLRAIYQDHFQINPKVVLSDDGSGRSEFVTSNWRELDNGSVLLSFQNMQKDPVNLTVTAATFLAGRKVENLTQAGLLRRNTDDSVSFTLEADAAALLYAYTGDANIDQSLINPQPHKVWIQNAPARLWPAEEDYEVIVAYDALGATGEVKVELVQNKANSSEVRSVSVANTVSQAGTVNLSLRVPDADLQDITYVSSREGGEYAIRASLDVNGAVSTTTIPVELLWAIRPQSLPTSVTNGTAYDITIEWQDLPSYLDEELPSLLERADVWPISGDDTSERYDILLELLDQQGNVVASDRHNTSQGNGSHALSIISPITASVDSFDWRVRAVIDPLTLFSDSNISESFEAYALGNSTTTSLAPWVSGVAGAGGEALFDQGVNGDHASAGTNSAFIVSRSHNADDGWSISYLQYQFDTNIALGELASVSFSFDYLESQGLESIMVLQMVDADGNFIEFEKPYQGSINAFESISATLDKFKQSSFDAGGDFDASKVKKIVVLVKMLETNQNYISYFDNIRITGILGDSIRPSTGRSYIYTTANDTRENLPPGGNTPGVVSAGGGGGGMFYLLELMVLGLSVRVARLGSLINSPKGRMRRCN